jgi:hypothetical protein
MALGLFSCNKTLTGIGRWQQKGKEKETRRDFSLCDKNDKGTNNFLSLREESVRGREGENGSNGSKFN